MLIRSLLVALAGAALIAACSAGFFGCSQLSSILGSGTLPYGVSVTMRLGLDFGSPTPAATPTPTVK